MATFAVLATQNPKGISADEFRSRLHEGYSYIGQLKDSGIISHNWVRVGQDGGLLIYEVESHEQLLNVLYGNPVSAHLKFDVIPLSDPNQTRLLTEKEIASGNH